MDLALFMSVLERSLVQFPLQDITNIDCLLALVPAPSLNSQGIRIKGVDPTMVLSAMGMSVKSLRLNIECISCTSPELEDLTSILKTPEATEDLIEVANNLLDSITDVLKGPLVQVQFDRMLHSAALKCPHHPDYQPDIRVTYDPIIVDQKPGRGNNGAFFLAFFIVLGCLFFVCLVMTSTIKVLREQRHRLWVQTLSIEERRALSVRQQGDEKRELQRDRKTTSLFASSFVPVPVRFIIPIIIVGNIALFLSGHFSIGAFVDAEVKIAGQVVSFEEIFSFSMANSIMDMWEAGAKTLAILVLLFSGVWPYVKLLTTLVLWFSSPDTISVSRRDSILLRLDSLGKWSFADIFVLIMSIVSFRVTVQSPDDFSFLPMNLYSLNLMVLPKFGLYANFIAQLVSQLNSHVILHYHRKITNHFEEEGRSHTSRERAGNEDSSNDVVKALWSHEYSRFGRKSGKNLIIRKGVNIFVLAISATSVLFIVIGCTLPSFALEVFGLLGIVLESGQDFDDAYRKYNIFSIVGVLLQQAKFTGTFGDWIGLGSLSVIFVTTVCLIPIAHLCLNVYRWFKPMNRGQRRRIMVITEALAAWQYLDVYIVSIVIASWQLGPLSEFMINDYCGSLTGILTSLTYYDFIDGADAQCFQVEATVQIATWLLLVGAIVSSFLNHFIGKAEQHFEHDMDRIDDNNRREEKSEDDEDETIVLPEAKFTDFYRWVLLSANRNQSDVETDL